MPTVQLFAACEKAIVDLDSRTVSVIGVIDWLIYREVPPDAKVAPLSWQVVSLLRATPQDDPDALWEQRVELLKPNGEPALVPLVVAPFKFSQPSYRQIFNVNNFPIDQAGELHLQLSIRSDKTPDWRMVADFRISLNLHMQGQTEGRERNYRRRRGGDTWHGCTNCSSWPTADYDEQLGSPTPGEFCNECRGLEQRSICIPA